TADPVSRCDAAAAHQNFAVGRKLDFAPFEHFADRTAVNFEGMIDADNGSGLSQAVTLNHGKTKARPEDFGFVIERGATRDEGPELPSHLAMNAAEGPPAAEKVFAFGGGELFAKLIQPAGVCEIAFDLFFERLQHTRHCDQHRDSFAADAADDVAGLERLLKENCSAQERRHVHAEELPKHMAKRKQVEKAERMNETFILEIRPDLCLQRCDVAENVAVSNYYAFGFGGSARGKNNLQRVVGADPFGIERLRRAGLQGSLHLLEKKGRQFSRKVIAGANKKPD